MGAQFNEYLVAEVVDVGRPVSEVAAAHGVSRQMIYGLLARFREGGEAALAPRSRRPHTLAKLTAAEIEDAIIAERKRLIEIGTDAGASTIHWHLQKKKLQGLPSISTVHRILVRRGFITPEPRKRPKSAGRRFVAKLPNSLWQADITHWQLSDATTVEILDIIDDHSRKLIYSGALARPFLAVDVLTGFRRAFAAHGMPEAVLTDNGAVFTASYRNGEVTLESELAELGIAFKHSRAYHPQTCGKVERYHQTLKNHLATRPARARLRSLQTDIDRWSDYYNTQRPHRGIARATPDSVWRSKAKAKPEGPKIRLDSSYRRLRDRVDRDGKLSLRYASQMRHLNVGYKHRGKNVWKLVARGECIVLDRETGEILAEFHIDPKKSYQPRKAA